MRFRVYKFICFWNIRIFDFSNWKKIRFSLKNLKFFVQNPHFPVASLARNPHFPVASLARAVASLARAVTSLARAVLDSSCA